MCDEYDYQNRGGFGTVALGHEPRQRIPAAQRQRVHGDAGGYHRIEGVSGRAFGSGLAPHGQASPRKRAFQQAVAVTALLA